MTVFVDVNESIVASAPALELFVASAASVKPHATRRMRSKLGARIVPILTVFGSRNALIYGVSSEARNLMSPTERRRHKTGTSEAIGLGEFIRHHRADILNEWEIAVRKLPVA